MVSKRDIYRLYRMLSALRKGVYWQSIDAAQRLRHESHVREFMRNMQDLQNLSGIFLTLFIFATGLLVALLQLLQALFATLPLVPTVACIVTYFLFVVTSGLIYMDKRERLSKQISKQEDQILQEIVALQREIYVAGLKDDLAASLSELRLLSELKEEYEKLGRSGEISLEDLEYEIESIEEASKGVVEERIEKIRAELRKALEAKHDKPPTTQNHSA